MIYAAVSGLCVLFNNVLLIWLDRIHVHYTISVLISAAIMIPLSFLLHARYTFTVEPSRAAFWRYGSVLICNTPAAWLLFLVIHDLAGIQMLYAAPIVTLILFIWNYFLSGWAILTPKERS